MGRIFEVRKSAMFARWDKMAKNFTRIGKEIAIAVKAGGPDPDNNPALRRCYLNAKACNMPKDRVEAAIKRAMGKDKTDYEEIVYEGYAPHGVAVMVETATDNPTRTVANVRMHFTKGQAPWVPAARWRLHSTAWANSKSRTTASIPKTSNST